MINQFKLIFKNEKKYSKIIEPEQPLGTETTSASTTITTKSWIKELQLLIHSKYIPILYCFGNIARCRSKCDFVQGGPKNRNNFERI